MNELKKKKHYGIVYTPEIIVKYMVSMLPTLESVRVCDPSCGNGEFLVNIAERIFQLIKQSQKSELIDNFYFTLKNLTGFDIDENALMECRERLNFLTRQYKFKSIDWNLKKIDAINLQSWISEVGNFDTVIGNPPYVRIQHLGAERRKAIEEGNWSMMTGCTDLYMLFFEMGIKLLKNSGSLVYITPNSWMKSRFGKNLRDNLSKNHELNFLIDFTNYQVFPEVTTYTAITKIIKNGKSKSMVSGLRCNNIIDNKLKMSPITINKEESIWKPLTIAQRSSLDQLRSQNLRLCDVADIHVGIQTQADDIFIFDESNLNVNIEREIFRRIYRASTSKSEINKSKLLIIYPYENGKLIPIQKLKHLFPNAHTYLRANKKRLLSRDKGNINEKKWYGYGREVSIVSGFGKKILTPGISRIPNFKPCPNKNSLFYSGYCIKPKEGISAEKLLIQLNSKDMEEYIKIVSRPFKNGWYSYAKSFIKDFPISQDIIESNA